jgi:hypothetical protein
MPADNQLRPATVVALATMVEVAHLSWEALHGGIVTHHFLARSDLPGFSNAWGLLVVPILALWASWRWRQRNATTRTILTGLLVATLFGVALASSFRFGTEPLTNSIFIALLIAAVLLPAYRAECLLGFVLGMSWTFGAVLPLLIGGVIATLSAILQLGVFRGVKHVWRRLRSTAS